MKKRKRTFGETIRGLESENSRKLMNKARRANRIAKSVRGSARRLAYSAKAAALSALVRKLPGCVEVRRDIVLTEFVVVELKNTNRGLHCPTVLI